MGTILFALFIIFIIWPLIKLMYKVHKVKSQFNEAFRQASQGDYDRQERREGGWSAAPRPVRKKIDRNVGEYVRFEEIAGATRTIETETATSTTTVVEQQIVDAEWEEIK